MKPAITRRVYVACKRQEHDRLLAQIPPAERDAYLTLAVQWHPEWRAAETPSSKALFAAFGEACAARARTRGSRGARGAE